MTVLSTIFLLIILSICNAKPSINTKCLTDTNDFVTKVDNSSIVVYGKTTAKSLDANDDSTFHVKFEVDCILKGPATAREINIVNIGQVNGRKYCQDYPVGNNYVIGFLEYNPLNNNDTETFIPTDFLEIPYETNTTDEILADTCYLHQLPPLGSSPSMTDKCPDVSTASHCITTTTIINLYLNVPSSSDRIQSKSGKVSVDVDAINGVNSIQFSILLISIAICFVRFN